MDIPLDIRWEDFQKSSTWFAGYLEGGLAGYTALTALLTTTLSQQFVEENLLSRPTTHLYIFQTYFRRFTFHAAEQIYALIPAHVKLSVII